MSAMQTTTYQWAPDIVEFARRFDVDQQLDALREATLRTFPTATSFRVFLQDDPEIRDLTFFIWEVWVPQNDVPNFLMADRYWCDEFYNILAPPYQCPFVLRLEREPSENPRDFLGLAAGLETGEVMEQYRRPVAINRHRYDLARQMLLGSTPCP